MNRRQHDLKVYDVGAHLLASVARTRSSGYVTWHHDHHAIRMLFVSGRPQSVSVDGSAEVSQREAVVQHLKAVAMASQGTCVFEPQPLSEVAHKELLRVDTLGELLEALYRGAEVQHIEAFECTRAKAVVRLAPVFERMAQIIFGATQLTLERPAAGVHYEALVAGGRVETRRAWMCMAIVGGVALDPKEPDAAALEQKKPSAVSLDAKVTSSRDGVVGDESSLGEEAQAAKLRVVPSNEAHVSVVEPKGLRSGSDQVQGAVEDMGPGQLSEVVVDGPDEDNRDIISLDDVKLQKRIEDVKHHYSLIGQRSYYDILELGADASESVIDQACQERLQRWNPEALPDPCPDRILSQANELCKWIREAQQTLLEAEARAAYDIYVGETEPVAQEVNPEVMKKAHIQFEKAKRMVQFGNVTGALPLLRECVRIHGGDPEQWAYLGHALYVVNGGESLEEAKAALERALDGAPDLDIIYEFYGRIARLESDLPQAKKYLERCLELNEANFQASRELRLVDLAQVELRNRRKEAWGVRLKRWFGGSSAS